MKINTSLITFLFVLVFLSFSDQIISQDCDIECEELIVNTTLDLTYNGSNTIYLHNAFFLNSIYVSPWLATAGSPHLAFLQPNGNCWNGSYDPATQVPLFNCLAASYTISENEGYMEGIMQDVEFNGDGFSEYCIEVNANLNNCLSFDLSSMNMVLRAGNNLVNEVDFITNTLPFELPGLDVDPIKDFEINSFDPIDFSTSFTPTQNYSQFEIIASLNAENIDLNGNDYQVLNMTINNVSIKCETKALTDIQTGIDDLDVLFTAENASSTDFMEYNWTFGDTKTSTEASPTHTYDKYGSYKVCLDVVTVSNCCGSICKIITVIPPPIPCDYDEEKLLYFDGTNDEANRFSELGLFQSGGTLSGKHIVVNGSFTLDENFIFQGCHFYFTGGAELVVKSPGKIEIKYGTLQGCDMMWKGITVEGDMNNPNYRFVFEYNTISDAYTALVIAHGSNIQQKFNTFDTNYIGIYSPESGFIKNHFGSPVRGSKFLSTKTMLPAYGTMPMWKEKTYAGIVIYDLDFIQISKLETYRNTFDGIGNGILIDRASFIAFGNDFKNIYELDGIDDKGIFAREFALGVVFGNTFEKVEAGIILVDANGSNILVSKNTFTNVADGYMYHGGILIQKCNGSRISVTENILKNHQVVVNNSHSLQSFSLFDNEITDFKSSQSAFRLTNLHKVVNAPAFIHENKATTSNSLSVSAMIISNCDNFVINDNVFNGNVIGNEVNKGLMSIIFSERCLIRDNSSNFISGSANGYDIIVSPGNIFCCNTAKSTYRGIRFYGENKRTELRSSIFNQSNTGLYLQNAEIGDQDLYGNYWENTLGNTRAEYFANMGDPNSYLNSLFTVNPTQSGTLPIEVVPNLWFEPVNGFAYLCPENNSNETCNSDNWDGFNFNSPPPSEDPCEHIKQQLIEYVGAEVYWHFQNQNDWVFLTYVFENYKDIPLEVWGDCFPFEERDINVKTVAKYYHTEKAYKEAYMPTGPELDQFDALYTLIDTKIETLNTLLEMIETDEDYANNVIDIIDLQTQISQLNTDWKTIVDDIEVRAEIILSDLTNEIDDLPNDFDFLDELQYIWKIKVLADLHGISSITANQWDEVRNIANACILKYGKSVFEAQELLIQIGDYNFVINEECYESVPRERKERNLEVMCFPNPSNGIFHLEIRNSEASTLLVELFDINGRIIQTDNHHNNEGDIKLDLTHQNSGIFYLKITNEASILYQKKLVLIK